MGHWEGVSRTSVRLSKNQNPRLAKREFGRLSDRNISGFSFRQANGEIATSSVTGTGFDLALFRLRDA
jgi:hypothetical protein